MTYLRIDISAIPHRLRRLALREFAQPRHAPAFDDARVFHGVSPHGTIWLVAVPQGRNWSLAMRHADVRVATVLSHYPGNELAPPRSTADLTHVHVRAGIDWRDAIGRVTETSLVWVSTLAAIARNESCIFAPRQNDSASLGMAAYPMGWVTSGLRGAVHVTPGIELTWELTRAYQARLDLEKGA